MNNKKQKSIEEIKERAFAFAIAFLLVAMFLTPMLLWVILRDGEGAEIPEVSVPLSTEQSVLEEQVLAADSEDVVEKVVPINLEQAVKINDDTIAWLEIEDTYISAPVLQGYDNLTYLRTDIYGENDICGSIFADFECNFTEEKMSQNTIIYGHNWQTSENKGLSQLHRYTDISGAFFALHPNITLELLNGETLMYDVVFAGNVSADTDSAFIEPNPSLEHLNTINNVISENNVLQTNVLLDENTSFLTLSTCTDDENERLIVLSVLKEA